jgi:crotonobetainyl-CoA:carnitine CoA-transferase CaiB-like acyl-CoA transferase
LGVIVMGAELARLLADQGADVIKLESRGHPDGARVSPEQFAVGHRGSRSLGLDLRTPKGSALFKQLAAHSDIVLSNFKPGTMEKLGLGYDDLKAVNDRLVMVSSSAVGATGPWSGWMGYGPLVRSAAGATSLWRYPDEPESFSDGTTIYPDHFAARVVAVAVLAALIDRGRTGRGTHVRSSQAEAFLTQSSDLIAAESLAPGSVTAIGNEQPDSAPWNVYPCAGDDEWCVITVRDDTDWGRLRDVLGDPEWARDEDLATTAGRVARRAEIDAHLTAWTARRAPREATQQLQSVGVPTGFMQRADEYEDDPHLAAREFLVDIEQPGMEPMLIENGPFRATHIPAPEITPAPEMGQHTREITRELLALDDAEVDRLIAAGVLQESVAAVAA